MTTKQSEGLNHALTFDQAQAAGIKQSPAEEYEVIPEEKGIVLEGLLRTGFATRADFGPKLRVRLKVIERPFRMRGRWACPHGPNATCACGYWGVRVKSEYGPTSTLLYDPHTHRVSGVLRLREEVA